MTLQELYNKEYPNTEWIGVYEGPGINIIPDNADDYLQDLGECTVMNYAYNEEDDVLIVDLGIRREQRK